MRQLASDIYLDGLRDSKPALAGRHGDGSVGGAHSDS